MICVVHAARRTHVQASGGDLRATRDQGEGGGRQAASAPDGAHQPGAGSGEHCVLLSWNKYFKCQQPSFPLFTWIMSSFRYLQTFLQRRLRLNICKLSWVWLGNISSCVNTEEFLYGRKLFVLLHLTSCCCQLQKYRTSATVFIISVFDAATVLLLSLTHLHKDRNCSFGLKVLSN